MNRKMVQNRITLGKSGEEAASRYLARVGVKVLERNWRAGGLGEIDVIGEDDGTIVFVEVKTRSGIGTGLAAEAVTAAKLERLKRLALEWMTANCRHGEYRLDVMGVYSRAGREPIFEWLQDVAQ